MLLGYHHYSARNGHKSLFKGGDDLYMASPAGPLLVFDVKTNPAQPRFVTAL